MNCTKSSRTHRVRALLTGLVVLSNMLLGTASAAILTQNRLSYYDITFSQQDFSDASSHYDVRFDAIPDAAGDTRIFNPSLKLNYTNLVTDSVGGVEWTNVVPGVSSFDSTLHSANGDPGRMRFGYDSAAVADFNNLGSFGNSWLEVKNIAGFHALRFGGPFGFQGGGAGIIDQGRFDLEVYISGDWSSLGTGIGQLEVINFNPLWTIVNNFVYDSVSDKTHFLAHIQDYLAGTGEDPRLDFVLHSGVPVPAVPEPSAFALAGIGALMVAVVHRRRRRAGDAAS